MESKDLEERDFEVVWIEGKIKKTKYVIGCTYRAPDSPVNEFFDYLDDVISAAHQAGKEVIITGDFNCNFHEPSLAQTNRALEFLDATNTRHSENSSTLIDVLITSTPGIFSRAGVLETSLSDHLPIYRVIPRVFCHSQHQVISMRKWREESITVFCEDLSHMPWGTLRSAPDINEKVDVWSKFLKSCMDNHFPLRKKRIRKTTHPWLNSSILRLMRRRNQLHRRIREFGE